MAKWKPGLAPKITFRRWWGRWTYRALCREPGSEEAVLLGFVRATPDDNGIVWIARTLGSAAEFGRLHRFDCPRKAALWLRLAARGTPTVPDGVALAMADRKNGELPDCVAAAWRSER